MRVALDKGDCSFSGYGPKLKGLLPYELIH